MDGVRMVKGSPAPVQRYLAGVVASVSPDATLREVCRKLMAVEVGALVVGSTDAVEGVISERDVVRAIGLGADLDTVRAAEVARAALLYCDPSTTMGAVSALMADRQVRHVLVGSPKRLVGIVSARDVLVARNED